MSALGTSNHSGRDEVVFRPFTKRLKIGIHSGTLKTLGSV